MATLRLHHVQLTAPLGSEGVARQFYSGVLGLPELPKPEDLAGRGGAWFQLENVELHVGVEANPDNTSKKRHWAFFVDDVAEIRQRLVAAGYSLEQAPEISGVTRFFTRDPFGNRLEFTDAR